MTIESLITVTNQTPWFGWDILVSDVSAYNYIPLLIDLTAKLQFVCGTDCVPLFLLCWSDIETLAFSEFIIFT